MRIAGNLTTKDWNSLYLSNPEDDTQPWGEAAAIFRFRIQKRFVEPADVLIEVDQTRAREAETIKRPEDAPTFGFAIMALDCLLVETLQGAIEGLRDHRGRSSKLVADFLTSTESFRCYFKERQWATEFYSEVRSNLLHAGATSKRVRINAFQGTPLLRYENGILEINRTDFHKALVGEFEKYIQSIVAPAEDTKTFREETVRRRVNLKTVLDNICG